MFHIMVQYFMLYGDEMWPLTDKLNKRKQNETWNNMGRNGAALSETRTAENRAMRWYEYAEQMMERLLGNGHHKEEEEEKYE